MTQLSAPRGTRDVLPPESLLWQWIEDTSHQLFQRYHYHEIRTPLFEGTELFARGLGEATDIVSKEMYTFTDRGDRSLTLRPEGTAGVVRAYLQGALGHKLPSPVKLWYAGPMFRYERPQAGRQRQFHQVGVEVLGSSDPMADAEVIVLAADIFAALRVEGLRVELNSLGCEVCRPRYREQLVTYFDAHVAGYCATCQERMRTNPLRVLDCKTPECKELNREAPSLQEVLCEDCRTHQARVLDYLAAARVEVRLNPRLVRGLDYYSRTVFEIISEHGLGAQDTVCAGGRYDRLVEECGGPATPAVGWAFGEERLALLLKEQTPVDRVDVYLMPLGPEAERRAFELAHQLRRSFALSVEVAMGARKLKKQLEQADRLKARWGLILGEAEMAAGTLQIKDLTKRGEAQIVPLHLEAIARVLEGGVRPT